MPKDPSTGLCFLCGEQFSQSTMTRHLAKCRAKNPPQGKLKPEPLWTLYIEGRDLPMYWMYAEMPARATLRDLDTLLRVIWLECCEHPSVFTIGRTHYESTNSKLLFNLGPLLGEKGTYETRAMRARLSEVLQPGLKFAHAYDFGSTTRLTIKALGKAENEPYGRPKAQIIARNVDLDWVCKKCNKRPAVVLCADCLYQPKSKDKALLCEVCAPKHKHDAMFMPVVNSPRMGVCTYYGQE